MNEIIAISIYTLVTLIFYYRYKKSREKYLNNYDSEKEKILKYQKNASLGAFLFFALAILVVIFRFIFVEH